MANGLSKKKKKEALQKLVRSVPEGQQVYEILADLAGTLDQNNHAFDRMAAIVGATFVEYALKKAICHHLTQNPDDPEFDHLFYNDGAPLWEFSSRVQMAKALGILEPGEYERLTHIRMIRNAFAHTMTPITFQTQAIADLCDDLIVKDDAGFMALVDIFSKNDSLLGMFGGSRRYYVHAVFLLFWKLVNYPPLTHAQMLGKALQAIGEYEERQKKP